MPEAIAGKLKWEPFDQDIRVELPAPLDWPHILRAILWNLFLLLIIYVAVSFRHGFRGPWWFFPTFAPLYVAGGIWKLTMRRTILTLTPREMTLNKGRKETSRNTRTFANGRLHNLRFCASRRERTAEYQDVKDSILCDVEGRTIAIMSGISKEEATTLIERMMAIYRFPNTLGAKIVEPEATSD